MAEPGSRTSNEEHVMYDFVIIGGLVVDGTGAPGRVADIGIEGGRITAIGTLRGQAAKQTFDATGLVVSPGFIDVHTHYDAQLHWDPFATPSSLHGVTTVFAGNCGFSLAPLKQRDADYTRRMMSQVEGMPLIALESGIEWKWETFGEYLQTLDGAVAVNAGFLVGHCALRRYVLGEASMERTSTDDEIEKMRAVLGQSIADGALGFSTSRSRTHPDHNGDPVPSRQASEDEVLRLCDEVGRHPGTSLEAITSGCITGFDDDETELFAQMSAHADRPLNWNVMGFSGEGTDAERREKLDRQLRPTIRAKEIGGRVVPLNMPVGTALNMSMATYCGMWLIPGWREIMTLPFAEKTAKLRDPAVQRKMVEDSVGSGLEIFADVSNYRIGETVAPQNKQFEGLLVSEIAASRGTDAWTAILDIEVADEYRTVLWPQIRETDEQFDLIKEVWDTKDVVIGGSDAGAHLDRLLAAPYPTRLLAKVVRERQLVTIERMIHLMTDRPAQLYGLKDRGQLRVGAVADIVVFDRETVRSDEVRRAYDLPGDSLRLTADAIGIEIVLVNGRETIRGGKPTGALAGTVLHSGRDTRTVPTR
jgi:N-acyl-D-aspartate/D-glutamate deacylase